MITVLRCGLFAVLLASAAAQDLDSLAPSELTIPNPSEVDLGAPSGETAVRGTGALLMRHVATIVVRDPGLDSPPPERLLARFSGGALTEGDLSALADALLAHYAKTGFPVVDVWAAEADSDAGTLVMEVVPGRVGEVLIGPGEYFSGSMLGRRVMLDSGAPVRLRNLESQLTRLRGNPFRSVELLASPGASEGEVDLLFQVHDRRPWRIFAGYENTGTEAIGEHRYFTGFNLGNLWGIDHQLGYQFTLGGEGYDVSNGHAGNYRAPLPFWGAALKLSGAYGDVDVSLPEVESAAVAWQVAAAIEIPLPKLYEVTHSISFGASFGHTEYDIALAGLTLPQVTTERFQLTGNYSAAFGETSFSLGTVYSPGGITGDNSDVAFSEVREDASASYLRSTFTASHRQPLPLGSVLRLRASGQWADGALLPSEQLALGGSTTVRGYDERDVLGDIGAFASAELHTPQFRGAALLAFLDWGTTKLDDGSTQDLASAGLGLRLNFLQNLALRCDYGWSLDGEASRAHLGAVWSF